MSEIRADNLGSLLRPPYLLEARGADLPDDKLQLSRIARFDDALALQEDVGLPVSPTGSTGGASSSRRSRCCSTASIRPASFAIIRTSRACSTSCARRRPSRDCRAARPLADSRLDFVCAHTDKLVKVTLPCPSMFPNYWSEGVSNQAYADREAYLEHVVELMNEDAKALVAAGADYIQLDAPHYAYIQKVMSGVEDRDATLRHLIECDNSVLDGVEGVIDGLHICRGNDRSHFTGTEPYDEFAASIFPHTVGRSGCCSSTTTSAPVASSRCAGRATTRRSCSAS